MAECIYCNAELSDGEGPDGVIAVPAADDDEAWAEIAGAHADGCEWVETRAHRLEVAG
jgi:hypothetical protein